MNHHLGSEIPSEYKRHIIPEIEQSLSGNTVLRIGELEPGQGWQQVAHVVLTPREREVLIATLEAQRQPSESGRTYVVGLPVIIHVDDESVRYEVDTSEASSAMQDAFWEQGNLPDMEPSDEFKADMKAVDADHDKRHTPTI